MRIRSCEFVSIALSTSALVLGPRVDGSSVCQIPRRHLFVQFEYRASKALINREMGESNSEDFK